MTVTTDKPELSDEDFDTPESESTDIDESDYAAGDSDRDAGNNAPRFAKLRRGLAVGGSALRKHFARGAVVLVFVASLTVSGTLGWMVWQDRELTRAGEQAQRAAVAYAQILTSIDSAKVDENFNQVLDGATGEFKDMYSQSSLQLRQLLIDNKAAAQGVVVESAVQSVSKNKVVVLLFVDQSVSNSNLPDPRIDRSRIKMTMEFVDGRWRASKVELP